MIADAVRLGKGNTHIHALVELDITNARSYLKSYKQDGGQSPSLTSYIIRAVLLALEENKSLHGIRDFRGGTRIFDEIDVFFPIENITQNPPELRSTIIRNAATKKIGDLDLVIEQARNAKQLNISATQRFFLRMPSILKSPFYYCWNRIPLIRKSYFGTVYISSILNMSINRRSWGIPLPMHSFGIFIGGVSRRLVKTAELLENRDMVQITIGADHRVSNGGDIARFVRRLKYYLEDKNLLEEA